MSRNTNSQELKQRKYPVLDRCAFIAHFHTQNTEQTHSMEGQSASINPFTHKADLQWTNTNDQYLFKGKQYSYRLLKRTSVHLQNVCIPVNIKQAVGLLSNNNSKYSTNTIKT